MLALATAGMLAAPAGCLYGPRHLENRACADDSDCLSGHVCIDRSCRSKTALVDAGALDRRLADAASADVVGADVAVTDRSARDTEVNDLATVDAGATDLFASDAAATDRLATDAAASVDTASSCGDGNNDGEPCDDNDRDNGDGCSSDCQIEAGWVCTGWPSSCHAVVCGDGIMEANETCDDRNASACGLCSDDCATPKTPLAAQGTIQAIAGSLWQDGDLVRIDDGVGTNLALEFDTNGDTAIGSTSFRAAASDTAAHVASQIRDLINADGALQIRASANNTLVSLVHEYSTGLGNVAIFSDVSDTGFHTTGMAGGAARDCPSETGCNSTDDCAPGLACVSSACNN